ncbi:exopolyphosphatase, partial [bacterium]
MPVSKKTAPILAALDLGSNSFHMVVARRSANGSLQIIDRLREPVRLGLGLHDGALDQQTELNALDCLQRFGQRIQQLPAQAVRAVGTNTLRQLRNGEQFLHRASEALYHPVDIISGIEEARLIFLGVAHSLQSSERRLVIDIGGGSTELIVGQGFKPEAMESVYAGCISIGRRAFADGQLSSTRMRKAQIAAQRQFEPVIETFVDLQWQTVVGASGTIRAVRDVAAACKLTEQADTSELTRAAVDEICSRVVAAGHLDKLDLPGLKDDRKSVFAGGIAVLKTVFEMLALERMSVSDGALREGLLFDLIGRSGDDDVRESTVKALAVRYHVNQKRAELIAATAASFLRQIGKTAGVDIPEADKFLCWATTLHTIGLDIAHSSYHKHGAYILANADLPGFSREEKQLLALLVRGHRRKLPGELVGALRSSWQPGASWLLVIIRLAVLLHRGRQQQALPKIELTSEKQTLTLTLPKHWLADHPLTAADL